MIVKKRGTPLKMMMLQAILRWLREDHPNRHKMEVELGKRVAGLHGEESIDDYLDFLPEKKYLIFHDIRLTNGKKYFQIDTLLISTCMAIIIETKNYYGELFFDQESGQLIRKIKETTEGFQDPVAQAEHQQRQLIRWMQREKITVPPIKFLVIISQPRTILTTNPGGKGLFKIVGHPDKLLNLIQFLENRFQKDVLTQKELRKLTRLLLAQHTPHVPELMKQYNVKEEDLFRGMRCPACNHRPMRLHSRTWICPRCRKTHKISLEQYINDYLLLIQPTISNSELRKILQLPSRNVARRILTTLPLCPEGTKKGRVYKRQ